MTTSHTVRTGIKRISTIYSWITDDSTWQERILHHTKQRKHSQSHQENE